MERYSERATTNLTRPRAVSIGRQYGKTKNYEKMTGRHSQPASRAGKCVSRHGLARSLLTTKLASSCEHIDPNSVGKAKIGRRLWHPNHKNSSTRLRTKPLQKKNRHTFFLMEEQMIVGHMKKTWRILRIPRSNSYPLSRSKASSATLCFSKNVKTITDMGLPMISAGNLIAIGGHHRSSRSNLVRLTQISLIARAPRTQDQAAEKFKHQATNGAWRRFWVRTRRDTMGKNHRAFIVLPTNYGRAAATPPLGRLPFPIRRDARLISEGAEETDGFSRARLLYESPDICARFVLIIDIGL